MATSSETRSLGCEALADQLETWALRREKLIHLLDLAAAKRARGLARRARDLGVSRRRLRSDAETHAWRGEWLGLKQEVALLLGVGSASATTRATSAPVRRKSGLLAAS
jgi:hypothetical protein